MKIADLTVNEYGQGRPFLILHGGGGPRTVSGFAELLAASEPARVLVPVHPGFDGTPRPDDVNSIKALAVVYAQLLDELDLDDVTVVGNSIGGWIAAELALLASPRVGKVILVDAAGLQLDAHPAADFFALTMAQVADLSYYNPDAFRIDVDALPPQAQAMMAANRAALQLYGGATMNDPTLLGRLTAIDIPTLVVWGAADRMFPFQHGEAYAAAIPDAKYHVITDAGHLPQLETPDQLLTAIRDFTA
jgi:pimeloyl-ACP methyl ester carboxylesterase